MPISRRLLTIAIAITLVMGFMASPLAPMTITERVQAGEYDEMWGAEQLRAIPAEAWGVLGRLKLDLNGAETFKAWRSKQVDEDTAFIMKTRPRVNAGEARQIAEDAIYRHPLYKGYIRVVNNLENEWYAANPETGEQRQDVELAKSSGERRNLPTKPQRGIIQRARAAVGR